MTTCLQDKVDYFLCMKLVINQWDTINNITVIRELELKRYQSGVYRQFEFQCHCWNIFISTLSRVRYGTCTSCWCIQKEKQKLGASTHGLSKHKLYHTWFSMMKRCYNTSHKDYKYYWAQWVYVCNQWHSCTNFIADMEKSYIPWYTLDRINPYGNYEIDNCRWADSYTQANNKRKKFAS